MSDLSARLRRLLFLVPYVARKHDGVKLDALARELDIDREELMVDIDLLTQVGPPSGDPGEYLLVSVDQGKVYVDLAQQLTRPLRLTPAEGCSLLLGLRALRRSGIAPYDAALASAEGKLLRALGADARAAQDLAEGTVVDGPDQATAGTVRDLVTAARERRAVDIEYAAASRSNAERRGLRPYGVVHHNGAWYVVGHCEKRGDTRTFRADRITSLTMSPRRFDVPKDFDLETYRRERLYVPSADALAVKVRLDPISTARVGGAWPAGRLATLPDGSTEITIETESLEWVIGWTLGFGAHAEIVGPPEARVAMRDKLTEMRKALAA